MATKVEKDPLTGLDTTGHEWDGIRELNAPLPSWWVYVFWATIIWSVVYWVVYPAWPTLNAYSKGVLGYSSRADFARTMDEVREARAGWLRRFEARTVEDIVRDPELLNYALAGGRVIFADNCAPCHGSGGAGAPGYPVLADDDWIWGGSLADIQQTIAHGVRSGHPDARIGEMPAFGADGTLTATQIAQVANHVLSLSGRATTSPEGRQIYADNCVACHGENGKGVAEVGGPNLGDAIWIYGSSRESVIAQIARPRHGVMPAWKGRLDDVSIKQATIYVHALGGGK